MTGKRSTTSISEVGKKSSELHANGNLVDKFLNCKSNFKVLFLAKNQALFVLHSKHTGWL
jgi:hypothetical protein